jgi:cytochrome c5
VESFFENNQWKNLDMNQTLQYRLGNQGLVGAMIVFFAAGLMTVASQSRADERIQQIYDEKCSVCHISGVAGAPKLDDKAAWASRLEKGPEGLLATVRTGLNGMPPMGTCMDCTDEDLAALIELMTAQVR